MTGRLTATNGAHLIKIAELDEFLLRRPFRKDFASFFGYRPFGSIQSQKPTLE